MMLLRVYTGAVDGHMLHHLASCIGTEWRQLAMKLGMPRGRIEAIHRSVSTDRQKAVGDLLTSWIKRLPRSADKVTTSSSSSSSSLFVVRLNYWSTGE